MNTPNIRFKGFGGDWEQRKVGDITGRTYGGGTPKTDIDEYWEGDIPWIQSSNLTEHQLFDVDIQKHVTEKGLQKSATQLVPANSIAVVSHVGVGKLVYMPFQYTTSQDFISLAALKTEPRFTSYAIYKRLQKDMHIVQGSAIKGITKDDLLSKEISVPVYEEQETVGRYFSNLDNLITLYQRKCDNLKQVKKYMLQKMFPKQGEKVPEIRFAGFTDDWEQRKFSDIVDIERGGSPRPIDKFITQESNGLNWVKIGDAPTQGNYITKTAEKIRPEGLSKTREVHPGDLILSNSMSFGKPYIMGIDGCIHDGWLLIRNSKRIFDLKFLCVMLGTENMLNQYKTMAAGSTVNNLNKDLVGGTTVVYPQIDEQKKIGEYFSNLDNLITLHQRKSDSLKEIKKFMLQNMFPNK